jgi:hypothetical protein
MSISEELTELLRIDVDEIAARAREYDSRTRFRVMRDAAEKYDTLKEPIARVKAMWIVQAMLACTEDRQLPSATSSQLAPRLVSVIESKREDREARRSALDALALVFVKTKQLTDTLDATIRLAFISALKSRDSEMSEFASEALSGEGVLAQRSPGRRVVGFGFAQPMNRAHVQDIVKELRNRLTSGGRRVTLAMMQRAKPKPVVAKTPRRRDVRGRSQNNVH